MNFYTLCCECKSNIYNRKIPALYFLHTRFIYLFVTLFKVNSYIVKNSNLNRLNKENNYIYKNIKATTSP